MKYIKLFENNEITHIETDSEEYGEYFENSLEEFKKDEIKRIFNTFKNLKPMFETISLTNKIETKYINLSLIGVEIFKLKDDYYIVDIIGSSPFKENHTFKCDQFSSLVKCINTIFNFYKFINYLLLENNNNDIVRYDVRGFNEIMENLPIDMPPQIISNITKTLNNLEPEIQKYDYSKLSYKGIFLNKINTGIYLLKDDYYGVEVFSFRVDDNKLLYFKCDQLYSLYKCINIIYSFFKLIKPNENN